MMPSFVAPLENHLWQSTVFAVAAGFFCVFLRKNRAALRYWIWFAASVKFLVPLSLLSKIESWLPAAGAPTPASFVMEQASQPFRVAVTTPWLATVPEAPSRIPAILFGIWFCGFAWSAAGWAKEWLRLRATVGPCRGRIRLMESDAIAEPCVFGIWRPVLLLPRGIRKRLTGEQLKAILLHEISHVRRQDNLTAAIHLLVEAIFWFYPAVYWIGRRLWQERETACDEEVVRRVARPGAYAAGIVAVCRLAVAASPFCAAGVGGSDLKRRIEGIMGRRAALKLSWGRKLLLGAAALTAVAGPVFFVRPGDAQMAGPQSFSVAVIKPNHSGALNSGFRRFSGGELNATNISVKGLLAFAYDIPLGRILQGPGWLDSERYDVLAKPEAGADRSMSAIRVRTQALLADRFRVGLHKETRQMPIFLLEVEGGGPKNLRQPQGSEPDLVTNGHHVSATSASMDFFAKVFLTGVMEAPVLDQTGISGKFDFVMDWAGEEEVPIASALREQLGLKLKPTKGPVEVLIVERAERASEN